MPPSSPKTNKKDVLDAVRARQKALLDRAQATKPPPPLSATVTADDLPGESSAAKAEALDKVRDWLTEATGGRRSIALGIGDKLAAYRGQDEAPDEDLKLVKSALDGVKKNKAPKAPKATPLPPLELPEVPRLALLNEPPENPTEPPPRKPRPPAPSDTSSPAAPLALVEGGAAPLAAPADELAAPADPPPADTPPAAPAPRPGHEPRGTLGRRGATRGGR